MKPRLMCSPLSGEVYVITRYTEKPHPKDEGRTVLVAHTKYDVTEDFDAAIAMRRTFQRRAARKETGP